MAYTDMATAFNLVLCYFATGDKEKMKQGFQRMLHIKKETLNLDSYEDLDINVVLGSSSMDTSEATAPGSGVVECSTSL